MYLQYMLLKIRKNISKFKFIPIQVPCPLSLPLLNISTANQNENACHFTANCLCMHHSYSSKFEFMNYFFANLVVAWWYSSGKVIKEDIRLCIKLFVPSGIVERTTIGSKQPYKCLKTVKNCMNIYFI